MRKAYRKWRNEGCQRRCNGQQHADEHYGTGHVATRLGTRAMELRYADTYKSPDAPLAHRQA